MVDIVLSYARENREQVEASSAREFDYRFDVPATASRAVLRVMHGDETGSFHSISRVDGPPEGGHYVRSA